MEISITERCTDMAAALATLGAIITPKRVVNPDSGRESHYFQLATEANAKYAIGKLRTEYRKGKLAPGHLLRRFHLGYKNRVTFLQIIKQGGGYATQKTPDGWKILPSTSALPGYPDGEAIFRTHNLKCALALITAGYDLVKIEGNTQNLAFSFRCTGPEGFAPDLVKRWRETPESFPNDSIFAAVYQSLNNREEIIAHLKSATGHYIITKPGTRRSTILNLNATKKGWDKARKFLLG
jgi:hypothetical protein